MERLDFKPSWFLRVFLRIFLVVKGMPSIANLIFIDYPSPKLHSFFCFGFLDQVLHIFHLDFVMTLFFFTNFQRVNFASNFLFFIFYFLKIFGQLISAGTPLEVPEGLNPSLLQQAWIQAWDIWEKPCFLGLKGLISSLSSPQIEQGQN